MAWRDERRRRGSALLAVAGLLLVGCEFVERSDATQDGAVPNGAAFHAGVSGDGRFVVFGSDASDLVSGDTNGQADVFVRDHQTGATERVSVSTAGQQGDRLSYDPSITPDGRFVVFASLATTLTADATNGREQLFLHDRSTGTTELVSRSSTNAAANANSFFGTVSPDGTLVIFSSAATNLAPGASGGFEQVYVRNRTASTTRRASTSSVGAIANGHSYGPSLSADGRFIAFSSNGSNLVGSDTNGATDVFVKDLTSGITARVSVGAGASEAHGGSATVPGALSADGRFVVFESNAEDLVPGDANGVIDVFVRDRALGTTRRLSTPASGDEAHGHNRWPVISADGRFVAFSSDAPDLVPGDANGTSDVFVVDRVTGSVRAASRGAGGALGDGHSQGATISGDGRYVAFQSAAGNLDGQGPDVPHVFLRFALVPGPLTAADPNAVPRGASGQIAIDGAWLDPAGLEIAVTPAAGVAVTGVVVSANNTRAVITVEVEPGASPGARTVRLVNPGGAWDPAAGASAACEGCLTIA